MYVHLHMYIHLCTCKGHTLWDQSSSQVNNIILCICTSIGAIIVNYIYSSIRRVGTSSGVQDTSFPLPPGEHLACRPEGVRPSPHWECTSPHSCSPARTTAFL